MRRVPAAALACAGLLACSPSRPGHPGPGAGAGRDLPPVPGAQASPAAGDVRFRVVYVIHGDADYVYHDSAGRRRLADEDALAQAQEVGRGALAAEVLIFHQKPRARWRSHPGGMAYRYRGGRLAETRAYARAPGDSGFAAEAALFAEPGAADAGPGADSAVRVFVYFGHEIPALGGGGYSRSLPRDSFSLAHLTRGLERFGGAPGRPAEPRTAESRSAEPRSSERRSSDRRAAKPFALIVLSACRGGTPATTAALFPFADRVLASPTELHLSYLDTRALLPDLADPDPTGGGDSGKMSSRERLDGAARRMLAQSFARLGARTQAPVALSLYDAEKSAAFLAGVEAGAPRAAGAPIAWRDCGEDPGFGPGGAEAGALVLYRAGRFGRLKGKRSHSGWECPRTGGRAAQGGGAAGS